MTHPRTQDSDFHERSDGPTDQSGPPRTTAELRSWVRRRLGLSGPRELELFQAVEQVVANQRQLIEESKHEAIRALSEGFAAKMERLQQQLSEKDVTVSNIARYFEEVVADLTEKSHRDPKTKLLNFDWFMERRRVVPRGRAARPLVRRRRRRYHQLQVVQRHARPRASATGSSSASRASSSDQIRSEDFLALERARRGARSARAVRRRRVLLPDPRSARAAPRPSRSPSRFKAAVESARLDARRSPPRRHARCASTSASSACGSGRSPSGAASRASSRPN